MPGVSAPMDELRIFVDNLRWTEAAWERVLMLVGEGDAGRLESSGHSGASGR